MINTPWGRNPAENSKQPEQKRQFGIRLPFRYSFDKIHWLSLHSLIPLMNLLVNVPLLDRDIIQQCL
jgi:hypothetical protein